MVPSNLKVVWLAARRLRAVYLVRSIVRFNFNRRVSESDLLNLLCCY